MSDTFIPDPQPAGTQFIPDAPGGPTPQAAGFIPDQSADQPAFTDPSTGFSTDIKTASPSLGPQPRGLTTAILQYPHKFLTDVLGLPKEAFEASQRFGSGEATPEDANTMLQAAMLGGVKLGKTVGKGGLPTPEERARALPEKPAAEPQFIPDEAPTAAAKLELSGDTYIGAHGGEMTRDQVRNAMLSNKQQLANIEHTVADPLDRARDPAKIAHLESQIPSLTAEIAKQEAFLNSKNAEPAAEPQFIPDMVPESVASAAIKFNDKIYIGNNHLEAMEKAATEHGTDADNLHTKADDSKTHQLDAWMTSSGRLIDSKEAAKIAKSPHEKLDSSDPEAPKAAEPPPAPEPSPTEMNAAQKAVPPEITAETMRPEGPPAEPPKPTTPQDFADDLFRVRQSSVADRAEVGNTIKDLPKEALDPALQEKLYHAIEDPAKLAELTPEERAIFDQHVQPLRDELFKLAQRAKELGGEGLIEDPNYVHRIAKGHAPQYDSLSGDSYNPVTGTRGLPRTTSALQERKYFVVENAEGVRKVVSKGETGTTVWNDGKPTNIPGSHDIKPGETVNLGGKDWEVKQATTKEIEAHTPTEYYKNAVLNTADAVVRMREVVRNLEFVQQVKSSSWWLEHAIQANGNQPIPKGWRRPKMPQFSDWYVDPKLADILDDFYKPGILDADSALRKINQFATGSIFWNPIPHIENVAAHWFTGRGWDWIKPGPIRHFAADAGRAIRAVVTQNKDYQRFLREGGGLVYGGVKNGEFYRDMAQRFGMDIEKNWGSWKPTFDKLGLKTPYEAVAWWYDKMRNVLWAANDMFMMHRYLELERQGMKPRAAIKEAEKHIPNYRIPPKVLGSRTFSQLLQEPGATVFSRYHYGMWKSYMNMVGDMAKGSGKEKVNALGNLAALGVLMYAIYPAVDAAIQLATKDEKAKKLRRGSASIPNGLKEMYDGKLSFPQFLANQITLAPATKEIGQQFVGKDFFTGRDLGGPVPRAEHAAGAIVSPYNTARQMLDDRKGGRSTGRMAADTVLGIQNTSARTERGKKKAEKARNKNERYHEHKPNGPIEKLYYGAKKKVKEYLGP